MYWISLILLAIISVILIVTAKKLTILVVSWFLARLLKCSSVTYGHVGLFSVTDVKLCFYFLKLEVDKIWLSSCFINQDYTKPIVLCLNDVRLEVNNVAKQANYNNFNQANNNSENFQAKLKKFNTILQYVSAKINNLNIALLNNVFPNYLVHLVVEKILIDSYRDRQNIQCELIWKLLTCKILQRNSQPGGSSLEMPEGATFSAHFDSKSYNFKLVSLKCHNPVLALSDSFAKVLLQLPRKNKGNSTQSQQKIDGIFPNKIDVDISSIILSFTDVETKRHASAHIKSILFNCRKELTENVLFKHNFIGEFEMSDLTCNDGDHTMLSCFSSRAYYQETEKQKCLECYFATLSGSFNFDSLIPWCRTVQKMMTSSASTVKLESLTTPALLTQKPTSINLEFSSVNLVLILNDGNALTLNVELLDLTKTVKMTEIGIEALCLSHCGAKKSTYEYEHGSKLHKWGKILDLGEYLLRLESDEEIHKVWTQIEHLYLEINIELMRLLKLMFDNPFLREQIDLMRKNPKSESVNFTTETPVDFRTTVRDFLVLLPVKNQVCFVLMAEECKVVHMLGSASVTVNKSTAFRRCFNPKKMLNLALDDNCKDVCTLPSVTFSYKKAENEFVISSTENLNICWSLQLHMILVTFYENVKSHISEMTESTKTENVNLEERKSLQWKIRLEKDTLVKIHLSVAKIQFKFNMLKIYKTDKKYGCQSKMLNVRFDDYEIFSFEGASMKRLLSHPKIEEFRAAIDDQLETKENALWLTRIDNFSAMFPYDYNFASAQDEVINVIKWLKKLHNIRKPSFYDGQPLPCDMLIRIQKVRLEMCDDLFEVKLRDNYELLMDEHFECERRMQILNQKIEELRKVQPILESSKVKDLFSTLQENDSAIYIERSKKLYTQGESSNRRTSLFSWNLEEVEIKALADQSYHGVANFVKNLLLMNPESESPWSHNASFNTAWCRYVGLDFKEWRMQMRDYPQPYWHMMQGHVWGRLAGAELDGSDRSKRTVTVSVGAPFEDYCLERNMQPMKFYYDLSANLDSVKSTYGPCWEPCLAMVNLCLEKVILPSVDPSPSLPFWDKIRLMWHGRLSMIIDRFVAAMLASYDPYDTTEQMEFTWTNFEFDWTNGLILVISDLDMFIRTASKYDDHCLLHLPALKLQVKMKWVCNAENPNDHHTVTPCAPDKLPDYSVHKEHDSYRAFRSQHLNLSLSIDMKNKDEAMGLTDQPSLSLYANTFRWLNGLKNTISAVNRPIKRGPLFDAIRQRKAQLSRHYRDILLSVNLPQFVVSYWASSTNDKGVKCIGRKLALKSVHRLSLSSVKSSTIIKNFTLYNKRNDNMNSGMNSSSSSCKESESLQRRMQTTFRLMSMVAELIDAEVYLYKKLADNTDPTESFFMSIEKLSYCRDGLSTASSTGHISQDNPRHKFIASDLKACWTSSNRDVVLSILDGLQKATVLRRNLSTDALKSIPVSEDLQSDKSKIRRSGLNNPSNLSSGTFENPVPSPPPTGMHFEGDHAASMLQQLISETATKFMAYSEETSEVPSQQLHGIVLSQMDDLLLTKWQIELMNSQVLLKGCEAGGFLLCTAAKAQITQKQHIPVWRQNQLLAKWTWVAMLNGMQYFATVVDQNRSWNQDDVKWLSKQHIQEKACSNQNLDLVDSLLTQGQSAGGVVSETFPNQSDQLQRIVSKCDCQLYFCQFTDNVDLEEIGRDVTPLEVDNSSEFWKRKEFVDCFTLKHNMLNICTNHLQYAMILDIVNNLILYVDPKNKESAEKLLRYRFQLQLQSVDDLRPNITVLQNEVREILLNQKFLERQMYLLNKKASSGENDEENLQLNEIKDDIKDEMERCKLELATKTDDLAMTISCLREKQVQRHRQAQLTINEDQQQAPIARRFEVCFEDALWRLTGDDGQIGLSDLRIRNFLYTKISRINDSGEHLLELGFIKITTLLPNSPYKDVLQPQQRNSTIPNDRVPAVRIICRELAPVGGISVKEHFEINVVPMVVQMSYAFFRTMMNYFFPDKNIDKEDQQNLDTLDEQSLSGETATKKTKAALKNAVKKKRNKIDTELVITDDIDKMKERAEQNNMFLYIKIPEVPFIVSYKGEKEKNIEDVENFQLEIPLIEYHDRNWRWLDLALAIKQRCKRVLLQQFMKQKLLKSRIGSAFSGSEPKLDLMNLPEEEKARMLLGTKLMGTPERAKGKSSYSHLFTTKASKM